MRPPPHIGLSRAIRELRAPDSDREEVEGDVLKCPDWIYSHAELETQQALIRFRVRKLERERGVDLPSTKQGVEFIYRLGDHRSGGQEGAVRRRECVTRL